MNSRNRLLHGNIEPRSLTCGSVWFDKVLYGHNEPIHQIPLFDDEKNLAFRLLQARLQISTRRTPLGYPIVRAFIKLVLSHVEDGYRKSLMMAMESEILGWHKTERRVGLLFGGFIPMGSSGKTQDARRVN